jgi:hypothetical protein
MNGVDILVALLFGMAIGLPAGVAMGLLWTRHE